MKYGLNFFASFLFYQFRQTSINIQLRLLGWCFLQAVLHWSRERNWDSNCSMRLCKPSNTRWALLWGRSLGEILVFHLGLYNSWSAGLGAVILGESFSNCLLTIHSLTSLGNRVAYMQHWEGQGTLGQDGSLSVGCIINLQVCLRHLYTRPETRSCVNT